MDHFSKVVRSGPVIHNMDPVATQYASKCPPPKQHQKTLFYEDF